MSTTRRALIVDDEPAIAAALSLAANDANWWIQAVPSAEHALDILRQERFDVVMVDKNLPGMSGVELIRRMSDNDRQAAVVMMTGYGSSENAQETLNLGVDAYVEKPFEDIFVVIQKINRIVDRRQTVLLPLSKALQSLRRATSTLRDSSARHTGLAPSVKLAVLSPVAADRRWIADRFDKSAVVGGVANLEELRDLIKMSPPAVVVIDTALASPPLLTVVARVRQAVPDVAVIVLCASRLPVATISQLIELNVRLLIDKPLEEAVFKARLDEAIARLPVRLKEAI